MIKLARHTFGKLAVEAPVNRPLIQHVESPAWHEMADAAHAPASDLIAERALGVPRELRP
jgi:hypothetical protein